MRNLLALVVILSITALVSAKADALDTTGVDLRIRQLQDSLENQIDRLKLAREQAGTRMSLARIRVAEELRRSEEDLQVQVEALARLREQLSEQGARSSEAVEQLKNDWSQRLASAFSSIETQLAQTNDLINRLESLRQNFDSDTQAPSDIGIGPLTITTNPSTPDSAQPPLVSTPPLTVQPPAPDPSPEPTPIVSIEPLPPTVTPTPTVNVEPVAPTPMPAPSGGG
jgi:hypothetical protein